MLFANWLTSTIIQSYDKLRKEKNRQKVETGQVVYSLSHEIMFIKDKFIRSNKIFILSFINFVINNPILKPILDFILCRKKDRQEKKIIEKIEKEKMIDKLEPFDKIEQIIE